MLHMPTTLQYKTIADYRKASSTSKALFGRGHQWMPQVCSKCVQLVLVLCLLAWRSKRTRLSPDSSAVYKMVGGRISPMEILHGVS